MFSHYERQIKNQSKDYPVPFYPFYTVNMSIIIINTVCDENNDYLLKEKYRLNMALFICGYSCKTLLS